MGTVTGTGLHHLQGEDEALLLEEGAWFHSGSSCSTPRYSLWWREGQGWTETTEPGRAKKAAHLWTGLRTMSCQCNNTPRMKHTEARTQSIQMRRTKFKLYAIMLPTHKGNWHISQRVLLKGTEFSGVLGARRIQTLKAYSMTLKITFIQTEEASFASNICGLLLHKCGIQHRQCGI